MQNLELIKEKLENLSKQNKGKNLIYLIPKIWVNSFSQDELDNFVINNPFLDENLQSAQKLNYTSINNIQNTINVNPYEFYLFILNKLLTYKQLNNNTNLSEHLTLENSNNLKVYNIFTRYFAAFDHNNNGQIDLPAFLNQNTESANLIVNTNKKDKKKSKEVKNGINFYDKDENIIIYEFTELSELGTFLKATMLLFYLKTLDINTIYLLPIFEIGVFGKKGNLGSPYAIKNYYNIDKSQSELTLGLTPEIEFKAFSEACKILDLKLILEFVFRITSLDNDWALENPDWFYWIKSSVKMREADDTSESKYGSPIFLKRELKEIKDKIEANDFSNLTPPHETYRNLFTPIPKKVARVEGKMLGLYESNKECTIASAFADWPPDDNQPAWGDVAYLRLYDNSKFNYVAYNTIRMYDEELAVEKNEIKNLWETLTDIIPYYISQYGIEGAMIDMGHALPQKLRNQIINKARKLKSDFIFWEENFAIDGKSKVDGYNASLGYFFLDAHINYKIKEIISKTCNQEFEQDFFLTSENHNTLRSAYRNENEFKTLNSIDYDNLYSKLIYTITQFLPQIKFIYNGFELGETLPTNSGLGFSNEHLEEFATANLPLFNEEKLPWDYKELKSLKLDNYSDIKSMSIYNFILELNRIINNEKDFRDNIIKYRTLNNYYDYNNSLIYIENIIIDEKSKKFNKLILIANFSLENDFYHFNYDEVFRVNEENLLSKYSILLGNTEIKFSNTSENEANNDNLNLKKIELELKPFEFCVLKIE